MPAGKICKKCGELKPYEAFCKDSGYRDGRRSDCNGCRQSARRGEPSTDTFTVSQPPFTVIPYVQTVLEQDLPDPERLPAAYLKRCSDYWIDLIGGEEPVRRIL